MLVLFHRRVLDARGRVRRVPPPDWRHGLRGEPEQEGRLAAMRAAFYGVPSGAGVRVLGALVCGASLGALIYILGLQHMGPDRFGLLVVAILVGGAGGFGMFRLNVRPPDSRVIEQHLGACRMCLSCGYGLAGVPAQPDDGCTVCPECGAAWKIPPGRPPPG